MLRPIPSRGMAVTITGFALIAITYGLVHFPYGQFMPTIRAELDLTEGLAGVISSALFLGNCAALLIAAWATERFGGKVVATLSVTMATVGLMGMAISHDPLIFAMWLMLAGSSAGFSMPPLVAAILVTVREERQAMATTIVNAGTGVGIMISGPIALYFTGLWRFSFVGFAALAPITNLATLLFLPKRRPVAKAATGPRPEPIWRVSAAYSILASAFLFSVVCAFFWTFGGEILSDIGGWTAEGLSWFWILIGTAGLAGAGADACLKMLGIRTTHTFCYLMVAAAIILLGLTGEH
ncbi:MFS transporter [Cognatiyoonia sp.]|uniref:MFS transporter n=1 Tax=Cognatiyoonia sp. TaxID=2211652 RepID=UPI003F69EEB7